MIAIFPEIIHASEKKNIELLSVLVRKYFGGGKAKNPRVDIHTIYENVGIILDKRSMDDQGAIVAKDEKGRFSVSAMIQAGITGIEERFLLAHLLGHYFLDIEPFVAKGDWSSSGFKDSLSAFSRYSFGSVPLTMADAFAKETRDEKRERFADDFAASLLMPKAMVKYAMEKLGDIEKLGQLFGVPKQCMERRLEMLGVLENETAQFETFETIPQPQPSPAHELDLNAIKPPTISNKTVIKGMVTSSYKQTDNQLKIPVDAFTNPTEALPQITIRPRNSAAKDLKSKEKNSSTATDKNSSLKGLARIREIAARLDKSVEK